MNILINKILSKIKQIFLFLKNVVKRKHKLSVLNKNTLLLFVISLLVVTSVVSTFLFLNEKRKYNAYGDKVNDEVENIIRSVGKHILLPGDKNPVVATIDDIDLLKAKEPFFYQNAGNGDKVLIYPDQVIIYNPRTDIIVKVAPVVSGIPSTAPAKSSSQE